MFYKSEAIQFTPLQQGVQSAYTDYPYTTVSRIWALLGATIVLLYLFRESVLYLWLAPIRPVLLYGGYALLFFSGFLILIAKSPRKHSVAGISFILMMFPGVLLSELFEQSFAKWAGWVLLFLVIGPVFQSAQACTFRRYAWSTFRHGFIVISILSLAWYILRLPSYWPGTFTGVTTHSMLLSPIAAMAVLSCANYAIARRSSLFAVLSLLSLPPCLLAGSRTAVLALIAGLIVLAGIHLNRAGLSKSALKIVFILFLFFLGFTSFDSISSTGFFSKYTNTLQEKGLQNTREKLWAARWEEFYSSPLFGIGIGMGEGGESSGVEKDALGKINVEPGSSYLALLSMTGISGAFGLFFVLVNVFRGARVNWRINTSDPFLPEVLIIAAFLFVNMIAEGWILAVGSPFCLLFWLCLGRVKDMEFSNQQYKSEVSNTC